MKSEDRIAWFIIAALVVLALVGKLVHAKFVYGDWTCAVAHCRKVKP